MWYLIVSIPDFCTLTYFAIENYVCVAIIASHLAIHCACLVSYFLEDEI